MRFLKLAIISFVVFFVVLFLMSLLIPSQVRISRAINIVGSPSQIHPYLSDTTKWKEWNEFSTARIQVKVDSMDDHFIFTTWKYNETEVSSAFRMEESAGITVVQWYFDFKLQWYPWEKFGSITFDKQFGFPMEQSLNNLKKLIENSP